MTLQLLLVLGATLLATVFAEPKFIQFMRMNQFGQTTLEDGPSWHKAKSGTPTMGGFIFLMMIGIVSLVLGGLFGHFNFTLLSGVIGFVFFGGIGFFDDFIKVFRKQNQGLKSHQKFALQIVGSAVFVVLFLLSGRDPLIYIPFVGEVHSLVLFAIFTIIWITGFSNAVNLTDGLDGLATSTSIVAYGTYAFLALHSKQVEIAFFCFSVVGGLIGFLMFNWKPAKIFMGDVGSLALGGMLAALSMALHVEWTLLLIGLVYVIETGSVMLQVTYFKWTKKRYGEGRRIFRMTPFHHHLELGGLSGNGQNWSEWKVDAFMWSIALVTSVVTLVLLYL